MRPHRWQPTRLPCPWDSPGKSTLPPPKNKNKTSAAIFISLHCICKSICRELTSLLEKEMATHSSVLAWRIPGTGEPGGLPSMGSHRVRHDWSDLAAAAEHSQVEQSKFPNLQVLRRHEKGNTISMYCQHTKYLVDFRQERKRESTVCHEPWSLVTYPEEKFHTLQ